jgi:CubicO group peptidase (beta-lactamase class C family)
MNDDIVSAHGGLSLLARDMAKFGQLYLQKGIWEGKRVLSEQWVEESLRLQAHRSSTTRYDSNSGYGYLWWIDTIDGYEISYACGYGGQFIFVVSDLNMVVVTVAETGSTPDIGQQHEQVRGLLETYILPAVK